MIEILIHDNGQIDIRDKNNHVDIMIYQGEIIKCEYEDNETEANENVKD